MEKAKEPFPEQGSHNKPQTKWGESQGESGDQEENYTSQVHSDRSHLHRYYSLGILVNTAVVFLILRFGGLKPAARGNKGKKIRIENGSNKNRRILFLVETDFFFSFC